MASFKRTLGSPEASGSRNREIRAQAVAPADFATRRGLKPLSTARVASQRTALAARTNPADQRPARLGSLLAELLNCVVA